jgi:hypothetical protein
MNDFYRVGNLVGRAWRLVRPLVLGAALVLIGVAGYHAGETYLPRMALTGVSK